MEEVNGYFRLKVRNNIKLFFNNKIKYVILKVVSVLQVWLKANLFGISKCILRIYKLNNIYRLLLKDEGTAGALFRSENSFNTYFLAINHKGLTLGKLVNKKKHIIKEHEKEIF